MMVRVGYISEIHHCFDCFQLKHECKCGEVMGILISETKDGVTEEVISTTKLNETMESTIKLGNNYRRIDTCTNCKFCDTDVIDTDQYDQFEHFEYTCGRNKDITFETYENYICSKWEKV